MKLELYKRAVLIKDVPDCGLLANDIVTLIDYYDKPEPGYGIEVFDALGNTIEVTAIPAAFVRAITDKDRNCVRTATVEPSY